MDPRNSIRLVPEDLSLIVWDLCTSALNLSISDIGTSKEFAKFEDKLICKIQEKKIAGKIH